MKTGLLPIVRNGIRYSTGLFSVRTYLHLLENLLLSRTYHSDRPQLFIFGQPRSGTTLIYQYIVHRLQVAYFTNGVGNYPQAPCLITFLEHSRHREYQSDFLSHYGKASGPVAPREAGGYWGRFFGFENYVRFADVTNQDVHTLRNTIACIQHIFGDAPFVNKNVKHMLRIEVLSKIFPNSSFLIVNRDLQDVALSVIRGRYENLKDPKEWWSVKPPNYAKLKDLPITEQIVHQILSSREKMQSDISGIPTDRVISVRYEQFCEEPENLLFRLQHVFGNTPYRNNGVTHFERSMNRPQTREEHQLIELLTQFVEVHGKDRNYEAVSLFSRKSVRDSS